MTRDDTIRMAREAGLGPVYGYESIERFAALIAAAEREACARVCENPDFLMNSTFQGVAEAIRARGRNIK